MNLDLCEHGDIPAACMECLEWKPHLPVERRAFVAPRGSLSSEQVCEQADVSYRQLNYWAERGVAVPSIHVSSGSGDPHVWSPEDVRLVGTLGALASIGCKVENLGPFSRWWADAEPPAGSRVAVFPDSGSMVLDPAAGGAQLAALGPCWVVPAGG